MLSLADALVATAVMAAVILGCRAAPFLFFRGRGGPRRAALVAFVEKAVPPVAMATLAVAALASPFKAGSPGAVPGLLAGALTALVHAWRRNALLSIAAGTVAYMLMRAFFG